MGSMKICRRCAKENPGSAIYCLKCGNFLGKKESEPGSKKNWIKKIPVLGWILIGLATIGLGLALIIGGFWALATVEGVASIIFLLVGIVAFGVYRKGTFTRDKLVRAIAIGFFALMGACVDQTGNYIFNLPVEKIACPAGTTISRHSEVDHPYAGKTVITQDFGCYNEQGEKIKTINTFALMGYRFLEYILLAYLLIGLRWVLHYFRLRRQTH
jgi:ribosomal protein L40E